MGWCDAYIRSNTQPWDEQPEKPEKDGSIFILQMGLCEIERVTLVSLNFFLFAPSLARSLTHSLSLPRHDFQHGQH